MACEWLVHVCSVWFSGNTGLLCQCSLQVMQWRICAYLSLMPRIPEVVLRPRVRLDSKPTRKPAKKTAKRATKKRSAARVTTLADRTEAIIADLRERYRKAELEFYYIGKALPALNRPEIFQLYGVRTFAELVTKHILPYRTAARFIRVAAEYSETTVQSLGVEKAYQLARLAQLDAKIKTKPELLAKRDAVLGKKRISAMSARDIEALADAAAMRAGKSRTPKPSAAQRASVEAFREYLVDHLEMPAKTKIDAKRQVVIIEVPLAEVMDEY